MENTALAQPASSALAPMNVKDLMAQVSLIQEVMKSVMQEGQHFGKVPGCGDKPTLLKPGAEKLCFVFRLAPQFEVEEKNFDRGHREYRVKCRLVTIGGGAFVGEGQGICSTMEAKYRFRTGPKKPTGKAVPKEYWTLRSTEPLKAQDLLGGKGYGTAKNEQGLWEICEVGEKVEHDNPADYYNTVLKMAQKRAHVAVTLTATAASDIFTQDLEDMRENLRAYDADIAATPVSETKPAATQQTQSTQSTGSAPAQSSAKPAQESTGAASNPPSARSDDGGASNLNWRAFIVPKFIKKYAGQTLGDMVDTDLAWWGRHYEPKGFGGRPPSAADIALRKALDAAIAEMESNAGEAAQRATERLDQSEPVGAGAGRSGNPTATQNLDEDVPF